MERPEGMERTDAAGFVPTVPPREQIEPGEAISRAQDFGTVGHLYRGIEQGLAALSDRFGERGLFVSPRRTQATPELFRWPQLVAVHDLASATAAINEIIEQGEGARGDWRRRRSTPRTAGSRSRCQRHCRTRVLPSRA